MSLFTYVAIDKKTGEKTTGFVEALDEVAGIRQVEAMGCFPMSLVASHNSGPAQSASPMETRTHRTFVMRAILPTQFGMRERILTILALLAGVYSLLLCYISDIAGGVVFCHSVIYGTLIFVALCGRDRAYFTGLFTGTMWVGSVVWIGRDPSIGFREALWGSLMLFLIFVLLPIALAWLVTFFSGPRNPSKLKGQVGANGKMTMEEAQAYHDLPEDVVTEVERLNKSASNLTIGMIISLFFPAGFLFVFAFAIARIGQSKALLKRHPELADPHERFPGKTEAEVKSLAESNPNLSKVLEFSQARKRFWVVIFTPLIIVGIYELFMMLT